MHLRCACALLALFLLASCSPQAAPSANSDGALSGKLVLLHAGSLSVPLRAVSEAFMKKHPGVTVRAGAWIASMTVARA